LKTRLATTHDVPALCELLAMLFGQEAEFAPDPERQAAGLTLILEDSSRGEIIVGDLDGRVIGMVNILYTVSTFLGHRVGLLEDMIVHPELRGQHLGEQLLNAAMIHAMQRGCARLTLLTDATNAGALRFYARAGFTRSPMIPLRYSPLNELERPPCSR
jgi:GNAT superfamily N-acetyltransferase